MVDTLFHSRATLGKPRRSLSPAEIFTGGQGSSHSGRKGGNRGDWSVVRSRKRKATQPETERRDKSTISERRGGTVQDRVRYRRATEDYDSHSRHQSRSRQGVPISEVRVSKVLGAEQQQMNKNDIGGKHDGVEVAIGDETGIKVSFYFTNFPEFMSMFRLCQFFEVCGILSDVYIARKRNFRGQAYGFLRFMNVKNRDKLALALNNVWIAQCRIWAREARFDRFASDSSIVFGDGRIVAEEGNVVVRVRGDGVKNLRVGKTVEGGRDEGGKKGNVGRVELRVRDCDGKQETVRKDEKGTTLAGEKVQGLW